MLAIYSHRNLSGEIGLSSLAARSCYIREGRVWIPRSLSRLNAFAFNKPSNCPSVQCRERNQVLSQTTVPLFSYFSPRFLLQDHQFERVWLSSSSTPGVQVRVHEDVHVNGANTGATPVYKIRVAQNVKHEQSSRLNNIPSRTPSITVET